jgi:hypothetical protein
MAGEYSGDEGYFIETAGNCRFGSRWVTEAGPFKSEAAAYDWLSSNRHKLMFPEKETRIVWLSSEDL